MGKEEQSKRNSPEFERRRWSSGELAVKDPISPGDTRKRSGGGGEEVKMPYDGEWRRRRAGEQRRRSTFSVPWSGGEAQGTKEQRKKKAVWG
jgi:hypothetical protein